MNTKIAIVTGGTRGLGKAISCELAAKGYELIVVYRKDKKQAAAFEKHCIKMGWQVTAVMADVSDPKCAQKLGELMSQKKADEIVFVHNASAGFEPNVFHRFFWNNVQEQIDVNIKGGFQITQELLRPMKACQKATVVNVLSKAVSSQAAGFSPYLIAKYGLMGLTQAIAADYKDIRVFSVSPGFMKTDLTNAWSDQWKQGQKEESVTEVAGEILRLIEREDIKARGENYQLCETRQDYPIRFRLEAKVDETT